MTPRLALVLGMLGGLAASVSCGVKTCDSASCSTGCCDATGVCVATSAMACAPAGQACQTCPAGQTCSLGACVVVPSGTPDPRCSTANCDAMLKQCHVEPGGMPTGACNNVELAPSGFDWSPYCVDACNRQAIGGIVACFGAAGAECADGGNPARQVVFERCREINVRRDAGCLAACTAQQDACNDVCTGGQACSNCRISGMPNCSAVCPDAGFQGCIDCSAACGREWIACSQQCPVEP